MATKNINDRMVEALKDDKITDDQLSLMEKNLRESKTTASNQSMQFLLLFVVLSITWIFAKFSYVKEVNILDIKIENIDIILLVLPPIAAFAFYQYQCFLLIDDLASAALYVLYEKKLKPFSDQNLDNLLIYPTLINIENSVANLFDEKSFIGKTTNGWLIFLLFIFTIIPTAFLIWTCYLLISSAVVSIGWAIASSIIVVILVARALIVFAQWMNLA